MKKQLSLSLKRLYSYVPTALPVGLTEFNQWADSIIELAGPYADSDSMLQALANMVMHASPTDKSQTARSHIPKNWFVKGLRKGAANQIAAHVFYTIQQANEVKKAQYKAADAAANTIAEDLKQQALEVTAASEGVTSGTGS